MRDLRNFLMDLRNGMRNFLRVPQEIPEGPSCHLRKS
jgi:hypothetical protein